MNTKTQKEFEKELDEFIKKYSASDISVEEIKDWVNNEIGAPLEASHTFQERFFKAFADTEVDFNDVVQIATEAWNIFPHKSLDGKSPNQMIDEARK